MARRKTILIAMILLMVLSSSSICLGKYTDGTGEPNDPYIISTTEDLNDIGNHPEDFNKCFLMVADINLAQYTGQTFNRIGTFLSEFEGIFDGNGHTIINFNWSIATSYDDCIGLFGVVGPESIVRNVILEDVDINALPSSDFVGALAGFNNSGLISGCTVSGNILGSGNVGGLVGYNDGGRIVDCHSSVRVSGDRYGVGGLVGIDSGGVEIAFSSATGDVTGKDDSVGGLIGSAIQTHIYNCLATGDVTSTENRYSTGGLVGDATSCEVENCYATGNVTGNEDVGGLLGEYWSSTTRIVDSYATGKVTGNDFIGAFIGYGNYYINCHACFWDTEINPDVNGIGNISDPNVFGETTANMQTISTFTDAGWNFIEIWNIGENQTYPFLRTHPTGDINHDDIVNFYDLAILADHWMDFY